MKSNSFNKKKICIIDYDIINIGSIVNAIKYLKVNFEVLKDPRNLKNYTHMILPGVGSFREAMKIIIKKKWDKAIKDFVNEEKPFFGICLGMQLMFEAGTEGGNTAGLGLFKGKCDIFKKTNLPIPHIGFNLVHHNNSLIWQEILNPSPFYFVHSYRILNSSNNSSICKTKYGEQFISFIEKKKIYGAQFHPEKSHKVGLKLLNNFIHIN